MIKSAAGPESMEVEAQLAWGVVIGSQYLPVNYLVQRGEFGPWSPGSVSWGALRPWARDFPSLSHVLICRIGLLLRRPGHLCAEWRPVGVVSG